MYSAKYQLFRKVLTSAKYQLIIIFQCSAIVFCVLLIIQLFKQFPNEWVFTPLLTGNSLFFYVIMYVFISLY